MVSETFTLPLDFASPPGSGRSTVPNKTAARWLPLLQPGGKAADRPRAGKGAGWTGNRGLSQPLGAVLPLLQVDKVLLPITQL